MLEFARRAGTKVNLEIKNVPTDPDFDSTRAYANRVMDVVLASRIPREQLLIRSFVPTGAHEPFLPVAADGYDFISPE